VTTLDLVRRPSVSLAIWPVVAFAAFAVAGLRAMIYALGHAGPAPTFDEILGVVDWQGAIFRAIAWSAPAGILALVQARLEHIRYLRSPLVSLLVAALAAGALWLAYQNGTELARTLSGG
jgi:hypothetical protein